MAWKPPRYIDGWSESLWKSLIVKSQRIGWPEGLRQAEKRVSPSTMKSQLLCGLFEDTFPIMDELEECLRKVEERDYDWICSIETHHGRGYTEAFCDMADEAMAAAEDPETKKYLWAMSQKWAKLWLPPRSLNCFYTWLKLAPDDVWDAPLVRGPRRTIDEAEWRGMPAVMADMHCPEGKKRKTLTTELSGSYEQHRVLGRTVQEEGGWQWVRERAHSRILPSGEMTHSKPEVKKKEEKERKENPYQAFLFDESGNKVPVPEEWYRHRDG